MTSPRQPVPEALAAMPPGPELGAVLDGLDPMRLTASDAAVVMSAWHRQLSHCQAGFFGSMVAFGLCRPAPGGAVAHDLEPGEGASDEVRAALVWTRRAAESQFYLAWDLTDRLPEVLEALAGGRIDLPRARVLSEWTRELEPEQAVRICLTLLPQAGGLTTGELIDRVKQMAVAIDPDWAARRYHQAVRTRRVIGYRTADGTANVSGLDLPLEQAAAACARIEALARRVKRGGDDRPIDQVRADLFLGMLDGSFTGQDEEQIVASFGGGPHAGAERESGKPSPDRRRAQGPSRQDVQDPAGQDVQDPGRAGARDRSGECAQDPAVRGAPDRGGHGAPHDDSSSGGASSANGGSRARADKAPGGDTARGDVQACDDAGLTGQSGFADADADAGTADADTEGRPSGDTDGASARGRPVGDPDSHGPAAATTGGPDGQAAAQSGPARPRAVMGVELRVRLSTLLGLDRFPAEIAGWGPTHAENARLIAAGQAGCQWRYALCDEHGTLLADGLITSRPRGYPRRRKVRGGVVEVQVPAALLRELRQHPERHPAWAKIIDQMVQSLGDHHGVEDQQTAGSGDRRGAGRGECGQAATPDDPGHDPENGGEPARPANEQRPDRDRPGQGERDRRFPSAPLRRHVQTRDRRCGFVGCRMPAKDTDTDHIRQWIGGGPTQGPNLASLCRRDHRLKDEGGWRLTRNPDESLRWTSRLGLIYTVRRPPIMICLPEPAPGHRNTMQGGSPCEEDDGMSIWWEPGRPQPPSEAEPGRPPPLMAEDEPPPF